MNAAVDLDLALVVVGTLTLVLGIIVWMIFKTEGDYESNKKADL